MTSCRIYTHILTADFPCVSLMEICLILPITKYFSSLTQTIVYRTNIFQKNKRLCIPEPQFSFIAFRSSIFWLLRFRAFAFLVSATFVPGAVCPLLAALVSFRFCWFSFPGFFFARSSSFLRCFLTVSMNELYCRRKHSGECLSVYGAIEALPVRSSLWI